eukprot:m.207655 g.207655  ORF g.207655 m.207655 type:complete len:663 (+) comp23877_c0_seq1:26-2014(+)
MTMERLVGRRRSWSRNATMTVRMGTIMAVVVSACAHRGPQRRPHVLFTLLDDVGWNNVGWHARDNAAGQGGEVVTPRLDALVAQGIELDRTYAFKYCSPSRCAIQSGRNPIHVNVGNEVFANNTGIPVNMTCLGTKMHEQGYRTIFAGKWHAGMSRPEQTPRGRGYMAALSYFNPDNDFWAMTYSGCPLNTSGDAAFGTHLPVVDLWEAVEGGGEGPAYRLNNSCELGRAFIPFNGCGDELGRLCAREWTSGDRDACTRCAMQANISMCGRCVHASERLNGHSSCIPPTIARWCQGFHNYTTGASCKTFNGSTGVYEDDIFADFAVSKVQEHDPSTPLFLFVALHAAHTPLQVRDDVLKQFDFISNRGDKPERTRQVYAAMVNEADRVVGRLVDAFQEQGLWEETLHVFVSDNGGPSYLNGTSGANNWPLKGGKMSNWDGGIRVASFVSGGWIPAARRGAVYQGLISVFDFYAVLVSVAGGNVSDPVATANGLPPVDAIDVSGALFGTNASQYRSELVIGTQDPRMRNVAGLLRLVGTTDTNMTQSPPRLYKLLTGAVNQAVLSGPLSPNATENATLRFPPAAPDEYTINCTDRGCLYNVLADPSEQSNLVASKEVADILASMKSRLETARQTSLDRRPGATDEGACVAAEARGGYWGPWLP